eukprot:3931784-Rhodomonas_salina.1
MLAAACAVLTEYRAVPVKIAPGLRLLVLDFGVHEPGCCFQISAAVCAAKSRAVTLTDPR